jgi:integrase
MWCHVDLDNATALICQQATREHDGARSRLVLAPVKTDAGRRVVQLPALVVAALRRQQTLLEGFKARHLWAPEPEHADLVFPSSTGALLPRTPVGDEWHAVLRSIGLEGKPGQARLRLHDLRHSAGTLLADAGVDTTVIQRTLGHARQSITADLYIGETSGAQRLAADRYDELLRPSSQPHADEG